MELLCAAEAGRILGLTADCVHYHEKCGRLTAVRAALGPGRVMRLYERDEVEFLRRQRTEKAGKNNG